jgi:hypothetical protein
MSQEELSYEDQRDMCGRLRDLGFRHFAFISYPNTDAAMKSFAQTFHRRFSELLGQNLGLLDTKASPAFIDRYDIPRGVHWEADLSEALCRSVTMVALCLPMYANSNWCGREWQGMVELAAAGLPPPMSPIFPVRLGESQVNRIISQIQHWDFSKVEPGPLGNSRRLYPCLQAAFHHVCRVGMQRAAKHTRDCRGYRLPERSAFESVLPPPLPNRSNES